MHICLTNIYVSKFLARGTVNSKLWKTLPYFSSITMSGISAVMHSSGGIEPPHCKPWYLRIYCKLCSVFQLDNVVHNIVVMKQVFSLWRETLQFYRTCEVVSFALHNLHWYDVDLFHLNRLTWVGSSSLVLLWRHWEGNSGSLVWCQTCMTSTLCLLP